MLDAESRKLCTCNRLPRGPELSAFEHSKDTTKGPKARKLYIVYTAEPSEF